MLGAGDIVNKTEKVPALRELTVSKQNNDRVWYIYYEGSKQDSVGESIHQALPCI